MDALDLQRIVHAPHLPVGLKTSRWMLVNGKKLQPWRPAISGGSGRIPEGKSGWPKGNMGESGEALPAAW
jgi:hypothetical protein